MLIWTSAAAGHPLDEYVQASYIDLRSDRVAVEIHLTPGVAIAWQVVGIVDADGDGRISNMEGDRYAAMVLWEVALAVDDRSMPLRLTGGDYPAVSELLAGQGTIRLRLAAPAWAEGGGGADPGSHALTYRNDHQPAPSAYLVNAYLPAAPFAITGQERDWYQRSVRIDYAVAGGGSSGRAGLVAGLLVLAVGAGVIVARRRSAGSSAWRTAS